MPAAAVHHQDVAKAEYVVLEFWRGTVIVGACELRVADIKQAAASPRVVRCMVKMGEQFQIMYTSIYTLLWKGARRYQYSKLNWFHQQNSWTANGDLAPQVKLRLRHSDSIAFGCCFSNLPCLFSFRSTLDTTTICAIFAGATVVQEASYASREAPSRAYQIMRWDWDVFICHAGPDKPFARALYRRMLSLGLRCLVDEDSLPAGEHAPQAMEAAIRSTHIAVVLLCEEFFHREAPQQELRWFLDGCKQSRNKVVPVFLGITVERFEELAAPLGLAVVTGISGVRHASVRERFTGRPVHEEQTMHQVIQSVRDITGV